MTNERGRGFHRARGQPDLGADHAARQQDRRGRMVARKATAAARACPWSRAGEALGLKIGDELTYDIAGEIVDAKLTSFREVQWDSFRPNFFMVFSPGTLDDSTGTYITSVHVAPEQRACCGFRRGNSPRSRRSTGRDPDAGARRDGQGVARRAVRIRFHAARQASRCCSRRFSRRATSGATKARCCARSARVAASFCKASPRSSRRSASCRARSRRCGATAAGYFLATRLFNLEYTFSFAVWGIGLVAGAVLVGVSGTLATRVGGQPPAGRDVEKSVGLTSVRSSASRRSPSARASCSRRSARGSRRARTPTS